MLRSRYVLRSRCGNGRYSVRLLKTADPDAMLTAFDLSQGMLVRARRKLHSDRVTFAAADLTKLPYRTAAFDAAVCGWVLEHLPDPRPGLRELGRVLQPGGKLLLMCTEDTVLGAWCSRLWHCRTYYRRELRRACAECGLPQIVINRVDLPAPLAPISATISPALTSRSTPFKASMLP